MSAVDVEERTDLESPLDEGVGCTADHKNFGLPCSIEVTHWRSNCKREGPVCYVTALYIQRGLSAAEINPLEYCTACGRSLPLCWTLRPI